MLQENKCHMPLSHLKGAYDNLVDIINGDKLSTELEKELGWCQ
jgi:hypothetical protein